MKDIRQKLMGALFCEAQKKGINAETLRNDIAPSIIGKRLSKASAQEIIKLIEHVTGRANPPRPPFVKGGMSKTPPLEKGDKGGFRYESSKSGLIQELEDVARARWGDGFAKSLNAFLNANRETQTHYKFLSVTSLKAIKERLREMNRSDRRG